MQGRRDHSHRLGLEVEYRIGQIDKVSCTNTGADHRPAFSGEVVQGQEYLIVDDNLTMGGTIASLRGYVENRGGKAIGASVIVS